MAKQSAYPVQPKKQKDSHGFTVKISRDEIEASVRKDMPPRTRIHQSKKTYRRRQKHGDKSFAD